MEKAMNKRVMGLGILYCGEYEFLVMPDLEADCSKPGFLKYDGDMMFCARRFGIAQDVAEFHSPAWTTVLGGAFIRWFPTEEYFDVKFPDPEINNVLPNTV
jgi:hypothetical protein